MIPLLFGYLPQALDIGAEPRLGSQLATALSAPGRHILADSEVASRGYAVRLHNVNWDEAKPVIERGLGVRFRETSPGELVMEVDVAVREREKSLLALYTNKLDTRIKNAIRAAAKLSPTVPTPPDALEALDKRNTAGEFKTQADKDGYGILKGIAGSRNPMEIVSGPALAYLERNSVRTLLNKDIWRSGDMYAWRDDQTLAPWVRERAVAFAREAETRILQANRASTRAAQRGARPEREIEAEARGMNLSHRLHFEPKTGEIMFEFSLVKPNLNEPGWFDKAPMGMFSSLLSYENLQDLMPSDAEKQALQKRREATNAAGLNAKSWKRQGFDESISGAMLSYAAADDKNLVMEIFPLRDTVLPILQNPDTAGGKLGAIGAFFGYTPVIDPEMRVFGRGLPGGFNAEQLPNGTLLMTNELSFMDRVRPLPMPTALSITALERKPHTLAELAAEAGKMDESEVAKLAAAEAYPASGFIAAFPVLRWLDKLPQKEKESRLNMLGSTGTVTIDGKVNNATPRLGQQIATWMQSSPWYTPKTGAIRTVSMHPNYTRMFSDGASVEIDRKGSTARITVWIASGDARLTCYEATLYSVATQ